MTASNAAVRWVRLGDYIEECDERNSEGKYTLEDVRGISTEKVFIPTKANMDGVSLSSYKIVRPSCFAYVADTSRRGDRIALALNTTRISALISSVYTTFRTTAELFPEYLYLLLSRSEFDRYARFNSWGSARETFVWEELCRVEIPLPSLKVQRELVDTYTGLQRLAEENEALIAPLQEACRAFLVECKKTAPEVELGEYIEECDERNGAGQYGERDCVGVNIDKELRTMRGNLESKEFDKFKLIPPMHFVYNPRGSRKLGIGLNLDARTYITTFNNTVFRIKASTEALSPEYLFLWLSRKEFDRHAEIRSWGSSTEVFTWTAMCETRLPLPSLETQRSLVHLYHVIEEARRIAAEARAAMKELIPALIERAKHV